MIYRRHHHQIVLIAWVLFSFAIRPYRTSLVINPQICIQCPHKVDIFNTGVSKCSSPCLWLRPYFPSTAQHVLFVFIGRFVRWEVSGCRTPILKVCGFQHLFKNNTQHLCAVPIRAFFPYALLESKWCTHTVVMKWLQIG